MLKVSIWLALFIPFMVVGQGWSKSEVFEFLEGDIFHRESADPGLPSELYLDTILGVIFKSQDSVAYEISSEYRRVALNGEIQEQIWKTDTLKYGGLRDSVVFLDQRDSSYLRIEGEDTLKRIEILFFNRLEYNEALQADVLIDEQLQLERNWSNQETGIQVERASWYGKGLGLVHKRLGMGVIGGGMHVINQSLVYYKKGVKEWGNAITVGNGLVEKSRGRLFVQEGTIEIISKESWNWIELLNLNGKILKVSRGNKLNATDYPRGIYLIRAFANQEVVCWKVKL